MAGCFFAHAHLSMDIQAAAINSIGYVGEEHSFYCARHGWLIFGG